jgi:uncharacterized protein YyaL (SSP411 family)
MAETHRHTNGLIAESSPYLLQHAHNPVDWRAWNAETLTLARQLNKPIFLSVGYSTCYWCHVMERQCFENETIAGDMNRRFINIKVDREERPDVDQLYMTAVQVISRQGGWPMSVWLTPDLQPFYGGTYFPPTDGYGRPGFPRLLAALEDAFLNRRDAVEKSAAEITGILQQLAEPRKPTSPLKFDLAWIDEMVQRNIADFDATNGGYGGAPKFPRQTLLEFLLLYLRGNPNDDLLNQVRFTLDAMAHGGIRDHLGGAFHRYSTDDHWLVPHFEIMLYDNAMLAWIYAEAFAQTRDERYAEICRGIIEFVLREMTSPAGAFFTALDAEVDAQEGLTYLWTRDEVREGLRDFTEAQVDRFCRVYGLDGGPNFADPHHGTGQPDKNVLYLEEPGEAGSPALLDAELRLMREQLYRIRRTRKQPMLDTKILTSWNALMIRALAHAGKILNEPRYLQAAGNAAEFLGSCHRDATGGLFRTSDGSHAKYAGFLDDYAFVIQALIELSGATGNPVHHQDATELLQIMRAKFAGENGFYFTEKGAPDLIVRQMIGTDSPLPSGNGVAASAMLSLNLPEEAAKILSGFALQLEEHGEGMSALLIAGMEYVRRFGPLDVPGDSSITESHAPSTVPTEPAGDIVKIQFAWLNPARLEIALEIKSGFHINANSAMEGLIATRIVINGIDAGGILAIDYPNAIERKFEFAGENLAVYEGRTAIVVRFKSPPTKPFQIACTYQPCSESACLLPIIRAIAVDPF